MKYFLLLGLALFTGRLAVPASAQQAIYDPYTVMTLAGKTAEGAVDGTGGSARFNLPEGVALDSSGNAFIADAGNHVIRKVTPQGVVTTFAGALTQSGSDDGVGSAARFNSPRGVAFDASGNLFVADTGNNLIRKITAAGVVRTFAGAGTDEGLFNLPSGLAVDSFGNVFIADTGHRVVRKVTPDGTASNFAGRVGTLGTTDGQGGAARFTTLRGIAIDSADNIYVADTSACTIRKITTDGLVTTFAGTAFARGSLDGSGNAARFNSPEGIAISADGSVFVGDTQNHTIRRITSGGVVTTLAGLPLTQSYKDGNGDSSFFAYPRGMAVDGSGNLIVGDSRNHNVRKVSLAGAVTTLAGSTDSIGSQDELGQRARFNSPRGIALDGAKNLYVADTYNHIIRKITPEGRVTTLAGTALVSGSADGVGVEARFDTPNGIVADNSGTVYVADSNNSTIRKITSVGVVTTLAGSPGVAGTSDGAGVDARFNYPGGLALDSHGNIYVADVFNSAIRKVTSDGTVTTFSGIAGAQPGSGPGQYFNPSGIAIDSSDNVYVADSGNHRIQKVTSDGTVSTYAGIGIGYADGTFEVPAQFYSPSGVAVVSPGYVAVADSGNHTIRIIRPDGTTLTFAGVPQKAAGIDGTGATARFDLPLAIAADPNGRLYVADSFNNSIRVARAGGASQSLNISTRLKVGTGADVLIGGFIAAGSAPKQVIIRAIGPSIGAGLSGLLADPVLELRDSSGTLVASNDSWKINDATGQSQEDDIRATTVAPANDFEPAILATVDPLRGYTATVRGKDNGIGIALVEFFDLGTAVDSTLSNISTRGFVQTGSDVLIGGFILGGGDAGSRVIVRAIGPSLTQSNVTGALVDPTLELHDGNGTLVASNDNWKINDQTHQSQEAEVVATTVAPKNDKESAIVASLPAGAYTAVVAGKGGGTGVALVEIFNLE